MSRVLYDVPGDLPVDVPGDVPVDVPGDLLGDVPGDAFADAIGDAADVFCTVEDTYIGGNACPEPPPFFQGVDIDGFQICPGGKLDQITPGTPVTYMELRRCGGLDNPYGCTVVSTWGVKCGGSADPAACEAEFDAMQSGDGFGYRCMPEFCYHYLAVNRGDSNFLVGTPDGQGVNAFLSPLETFSDVEFILKWLGGMSLNSSDVSSGGYREVEDGWEVIAIMLHMPCDPITDDRLLIHVNRDGTWSVVCRQLFNVTCGACI